MRHSSSRLSVAIRIALPTIFIGVVSLSGPLTAHASDPLIADTDLPGIPISITQGARREMLSAPKPTDTPAKSAREVDTTRSATQSMPADDTARQELVPDTQQPAVAPDAIAEPAFAGVDPDEPIVDPDTGVVNLELLRQRYEATPESQRPMSRMEPGLSELDRETQQPERPSMLDEDLSRIGEQLAQSIVGSVNVQPSQPKAPEAPKGPTTLTLIPGVNQLATISRGHPNRIVTPFTNPEIRTTANAAEITTAESVVYVATEQSGPVTLYISEKGQPRLAASLTLVPQSIPPQEIVFTFTDDIARDFKIANPRAEDWETRQPYVDTLVNLFKSLATEDLPAGYSLRKPHGSDVITCFGGQHVAFELGQIVEGHNIEVQVLRATNVSNVTVEVIGHQCSGNAVMAAAEWPYSILEPGQSTEMYVAKHRLERITPEIRRPSLIGDRP